MTTHDLLLLISAGSISLVVGLLLGGWITRLDQRDAERRRQAARDAALRKSLTLPEDDRCQARNP